MAWRVAITSEDGETIDQHFGRASRFLIMDIEPAGTFRLIEERAVKPWCAGCKDDHDVDSNGSGIADNLRDCLAVLTARIGLLPRKQLELSGIAVFEESLWIDEAVKKLAIYYARTHHPESTA